MNSGNHKGYDFIIHKVVDDWIDGYERHHRFGLRQREPVVYLKEEMKWQIDGAVSVAQQCDMSDTTIVSCVCGSP
ncbi:hypothetical protein AVEN_145591-1 [Araneus ventricosus]|uniref:Uncharacterized protein n=1 Tax=Araneus ventricosus TaxID=182803 RepID=A0A4Y2SAW5_ARAVE|nr:hypothetical protein AVEN_145591-1 [Araneus ventricosus]